MRQWLKPIAGLGIPLQRRSILAMLTRIGILVSAIRALPVPAATEDRELRTLAELIRELVPHPSLDELVYVDAAKTIRGAMSVTPQQIDTALGQLQGRHGGELPGQDQFLMQLRTAAVEAVYRDPRVWELIGYGGNALAKGGYRSSFNNIDWLPGDKT